MHDKVRLILWLQSSGPRKRGLGVGDVLFMMISVTAGSDLTIVTALIVLVGQLLL